MKITLRQLQVFVYTARLQSVSAAANVIHLTQSAASMALKELESALSHPLFDRVGKRLQLNSDGQALLPNAVKLLDQAELIQSQDFGAMRGIINIGATTTIGNYILPKYLARFTQAYPNTIFNLFISNTENVLAKVDNLELDIAFIEGACDAEKIIKLTWLQDELKIVCRAGHPVAKKRLLKLRDLQNFPWVARETGSGTREMFARALENKINIEKKIILNSSEAIKGYLLNSDCLGYLSKTTIVNELKMQTLRVINLENLIIKRNFYIVRHAEKYQTELTQSFSKFIMS